MFLEKNLSALEQSGHSSAFISQLMATEPATDLAFYETASGDYTLGLIHQGSEVLLHHPQGAMQEARNICDPGKNHFHPGLRSKHIILGLGLGYLLDTAYHLSNGSFWVYEPNLSLLRFVLENVDLSESLTDKRVHLATTPEALIHQLRQKYINGECIDILVTQGYAVLLADKIPDLTEQLIQMAQEQQSNINVGLRYHDEWVRQFLENIPSFLETLPFDHLVGQFPQQPAVIISSGPSLDAALPILKSIQDQVLTIAVGGALRPLLEANLTPDFAVFLDYMGPKQHLADLPGTTDEINFILGPFAEGETFQVPAKSRYLTALKNYGPFSDWLDKTQQKASCRIESGATVSIMAVNAAIAMGCNPIILVGQDLAFQNNTYYAGGVQGRIENGAMILEDSTTQVGRKIPLRQVAGWDGEILQTGVDYYDYLQHFEILAQENQNAPDPVHLYNASVGGAFIKGFEHLSLEAILEKELWPVMDKNLLRLPALSESPNARAFEKALVHLQEQIERILPQSQLLESVQKIILDTPLENWPGLEKDIAPRYRQLRAQLSQLITDAPLLEYALKKEIWDLQEAYCFEATDLVHQQKNLKADLKYTQALYNKLQKTIRPLVETSLNQLKTHENQPAL